MLIAAYSGDTTDCPPSCELIERPFWRVTKVPLHKRASSSSRVFMDSEGLEVGLRFANKKVTPVAALHADPLILSERVHPSWGFRCVEPVVPSTVTKLPLNAHR